MMARRIQPHPRNEVAVLDFQSCNQLEDRVEMRQPSPAFELAKNRAVHPGPVGELLLRQACPTAEPNQIGAEPLAQGPVFVDPLVFLSEAAHFDPSFGGSSFQAIPKSNAPGLYFERPGELHDRVEARETLSALDQGDLGAVQSGALGGTGLREADLAPPLGQIPTEVTGKVDGLGSFA
jgi:hypothetical protein